MSKLTLMSGKQDTLVASKSCLSVASLTTYFHIFHISCTFFSLIVSFFPPHHRRQLQHLHFLLTSARSYSILVQEQAETEFATLFVGAITGRELTTAREGDLSKGHW